MPFTGERCRDLKRESGESGSAQALITAMANDEGLSPKFALPKSGLCSLLEMNKKLSMNRFVAQIAAVSLASLVAAV